MLEGTTRACTWGEKQAEDKHWACQCGEVRETRDTNKRSDEGPESEEEDLQQRGVSRKARGEGSGGGGSCVSGCWGKCWDRELRRGRVL